ncbi:unnamed protein product [Dicrocoelium dendriticum]|nr:unnamed protein product [Dicrocoelium dendriticum]
MKSVLRKALSQYYVSGPAVLSSSSSSKKNKKTKSHFKNRRSGQLKRLRNEQYQRMHSQSQSWKVVETKDRKAKPKTKSKPSGVETPDHQLMSITRQIIKSRRSLFGGTPQRVQHKQVVSILFADETFRENKETVENIICS